MPPKRQRKPLGKTKNKQEVETVFHLSGDEDEDETKLIERTEYKDRIPETLELDLMESRTTAENLSKNIMIFSDYDSEESEDEEVGIKSKQSLSNLKNNASVTPLTKTLENDNSKIELDSENLSNISLEALEHIKSNAKEYVEHVCLYIIIYFFNLNSL